MWLSNSLIIKHKRSIIKSINTKKKLHITLGVDNWWFEGVEMLRGHEHQEDAQDEHACLHQSRHARPNVFWTMITFSFLILIWTIGPSANPPSTHLTAWRSLSGLISALFATARLVCVCLCVRERGPERAPNVWGSAFGLCRMTVPKLEICLHKLGVASSPCSWNTQIVLQVRAGVCATWEWLFHLAWVIKDLFEVGELFCRILPTFHAVETNLDHDIVITHFRFYDPLNVCHGDSWLSLGICRWSWIRSGTWSSCVLSTVLDMTRKVGGNPEVRPVQLIYEITRYCDMTVVRRKRKKSLFQEALDQDDKTPLTPWKNARNRNSSNEITSWELGVRTLTQDEDLKKKSLVSWLKTNSLSLGILFLFLKTRAKENIHIYGCRWNERQKGKTEGSTRLTYTGLCGGLGPLKIETRLRVERFESVMGECAI